MVAEMLQKCFFIFNVFLSKKLYIFTFNEKKNVCYVRILSFKENIFMFSQNILLHLKFFISFRGFLCKKYIFIQSKINALNEIFLFNDFW